MKKVSFDFDSTLDRIHVQHYAKELIDKGYEVWIVTSRFDTEHFIKHHQTSVINGEKANADLYIVANELGIPNEHIYFTNMIDKWNFFLDKDFVWHLDDDWLENRMLLNYTKTKGVDSLTSSWQKKCDRLLK